MHDSLIFYATVFKHLLLEELIDFKNNLLSTVIDITLWLSCTLVVMSYLVPNQFNVAANFGPFMLTGCIATITIFEVYPRTSSALKDFEEDKRILYYLTLPVPSWLIFIKSIIFYTINYALMECITLPIGYAILWQKASIAHIAWFKFFCILITSNLFSAAFTLWLISMIKTHDNMRVAWVRFIFPLWFLGCYQFSWKSMHHLWPLLAYIDLINPLVHIMEGTRAALLGQEGFLSVWMSCVILMILTGLCTWHGIKRLKKQLNFV
jgi:ABC-type polysaccharide/polyol phosphate export permease